jgi:hypothetical protein
VDAVSPGAIHRNTLLRPTRPLRAYSDRKSVHGRIEIPRVDEKGTVTTLFVSVPSYFKT